MIKYLEFSTPIEAEAFALKMGQAKGYIDANGDPTAFGLSVKTYRYARPVLHPKANALLFKDERAVCAVDDDDEGELTTIEKAALKMPADVAEFFPTKAI